MGVVDKLSTAAATGVFRLIQSGGNMSHKLFPVTRDRAQLLFPEVAPLVGIVGAEMYREGYEASKGNSPTFGRLITNMVEGGLSYLITSTVTTVYTVIGFLKGAYETGHARSMGEKTYAAIKNAMLFFAGFVGINVGVQYSQLMRQMHGRDVLKALLGKEAYYKLFQAEKKVDFAKVPNLTAFMKQDLGAVSGVSDDIKTGLAEIKAMLHTLSGKAVRLCLPKEHAPDLKISDKAPATLNTMKKLANEFAEAQNAILNKYTHMVTQHGEPVLKSALTTVLGSQERVKDFQQVLGQAGKYNNYELLRMMNPMIWYVLGIGLCIPLVKFVSYMLSNPESAPIDSRLSQRDTSLYLNSFPKFQAHTGNVFAGLGNHGSHGSSDAFPYYNGPGLIQWAADHRI